MKTKYDLTSEQLEYLKEIAPLHKRQKISDLFFKKYNIRLPLWKVDRIKAKYNIKYQYIMNEEMENYFKTIIKDNSYKKISELFFKKYNIKLSRNQIWYYCNKYNIHNGIDQTKLIGKMKYNYKGAGHEWIDKRTGYTYVTVKSGCYVQKQRYIYEKHYGKIPKGYSIIFLDNDKTNFDIDNLLMVKDTEKGLFGCYKIYSKDKEIQKLVISLIKMKDKENNYRRKYGNC